MNIATLERPRTARPKTFLEREFPAGRGAKEVIITPRLAEELLARNYNNRHVSKTKIAHYATDMRDGRWALNGASLVIGDDGSLLDGQHRLLACIEANESFETLMYVGAGRETRTTMDQGRARTVGDYLTMQGVENSKMVAAVAKRVLAFERSNRTSVDGKYLTHAEVLDYQERHHEELATSATYGNSAGSFSSAAGKSYVATWHYILNSIGGDLGVEYLDQIVRGEGLRLADPAMTVRNRLFQMGRSSLSAKTEAVLRGWVYFRDGKKLVKVQLMGEFPAL